MVRLPDPIAWSLGTAVTALTVPAGLGPALGGWLAARGATDPRRGAATGAAVGAVAALPWAWLVYLATVGAIDPIGYHRGVVHLGVIPAPPGLVAPWGAAAVAALVGAVVAAVAACGGAIAAATPERPSVPAVD